MNAAKASLVAAMNTIVLSLTNEAAYRKWLDVIAEPESADDRKCADVASDEGWFSDAVHTFLGIVKKHGGEGFSISGRVYK